MNSPEITTIIDFVEGRLSAKDFELLFHNNPKFKAVFDNDPHLPSTSYVGQSVYLYVLQENFNDPAEVLNVHGALIEFLTRNGIAHEPTNQYEEFHQILLSAQPKWLDVDTAYMQSKILPAAGDRTGDDLKQWLQTRLLELFRYIEQPPDWIQDPTWPIGEHGPLVFLGQLSINHYFHDEAAVYIFHDPNTGGCVTMIQVC